MLMEAAWVPRRRDQRQQDRRYGDDRTDGKIDAAHQDDERLPGSGNADHSSEFEQVAQVAIGAETAQRDTCDDPDERDQKEGQQRRIAERGPDDVHRLALHCPRSSGTATAPTMINP